MRAAKLSIRSLCLCASVFLPFRASASVKAGGYLKNFWQYSHSAFDGRDYNLDTFRARLSLEGDRGPLKAHLDFDQQVAAGSFFRTTEFRAFGYAPPKPWLDMERTISTGTTNGYGVGAYRAWIGVEDEDRVLRAGRQRIAWGTGKLWNPTDVLIGRPYDYSSITTIDYAEHIQPIFTSGCARTHWFSPATTSRAPSNVSMQARIETSEETQAGAPPISDASSHWRSDSISGTAPRRSKMARASMASACAR